MPLNTFAVIPANKLNYYIFNFYILKLYLSSIKCGSIPMEIGVIVDATANLAGKIYNQYKKVVNYNWELKFETLKVLEEIGIYEIVDPLIENDISAYAIYMPSIENFDEKDLELIEKTAMIADELKSEMLVLPAETGKIDTIFLDKVFELVSNYKLKLCFDTKHEIANVMEIFNILSNYIGGVFYISTTLSILSKHETMLSVVEDMHGLLKIIHVGEKDVNLLKKDKSLFTHYYNFIEYLIKKNYVGYLALPFSTDDHFIILISNLKYFLKIFKEREFEHVR